MTTPPTEAQLLDQARKVFLLPITQQLFDSAIPKAEKSAEGRKIIILHDYDDFETPYECLNIQTLVIEDLLEFDKNEIMFVYACQDDHKGCRVVEFLFNHDYRVHALAVGRHSKNFGLLNEKAREAYIEEYVRQKREGWAKFDNADFFCLMEAIRNTAHLEGDFVEIGCFNGSSGSVALNFMKRSSLKANCFFYDVFTGFDYPEAKTSPDVVWKGTHKSQGQQTVTRRLKSFEDPDIGLHVTVLKRNIITDELPNQKIRLASIDVDIYEGVYAALVKVAPKMVYGGVILVEDPPHTPGLIGARVAYEKFMRSELAEDFMPICPIGAQFLLIKMGRGFRNLENENKLLKRMYIEAQLENEILREKMSSR